MSPTIFSDISEIRTDRVKKHKIRNNGHCPCIRLSIQPFSYLYPLRQKSNKTTKTRSETKLFRLPPSIAFVRSSMDSADSGLLRLGKRLNRSARGRSRVGEGGSSRGWGHSGQPPEVTPRVPVGRPLRGWDKENKMLSRMWCRV